MNLVWNPVASMPHSVCDLSGPTSTHRAATIFLQTLQSPSTTTLATLSLTSSTTLMPFPSSSPSPSPHRAEQSSTSPWHHKASNTQLEPCLSHLPLRPFETPPPSPRDPPLSHSYPLSNISPLIKQKRPFRDFSTGLLVVPSNQLGNKVTSTSQPFFGHIADARTLC